MSKLKSIAVLCSGGDSPGMNCAIRAIVRTAIHEGVEIFGIQKGYQGLLEGNIRPLSVSSVGNILQHVELFYKHLVALNFMKPKREKRLLIF